MFKYPYGDSQQLNLDWILRKLKELEGEVGQQITEDLEVISNALIAESYSSANAYNRSDVVYHDGKLYRANVNIPAPGESWNPAHWDEIMLGDTVANLVRYVGSLSNNQVFNSSTVPGTHTSDALDNLKSDITQIDNQIDTIQPEVDKIQQITDVFDFYNPNAAYRIANNQGEARVGYTFNADNTITVNKNYTAYGSAYAFNDSLMLQPGKYNITAYVQTSNVSPSLSSPVRVKIGLSSNDAQYPTLTTTQGGSTPISQGDNAGWLSADFEVTEEETFCFLVMPNATAWDPLTISNLSITGITAYDAEARTDINNLTDAINDFAGDITINTAAELIRKACNFRTTANIVLGSTGVTLENYARGEIISQDGATGSIIAVGYSGKIYSAFFTGGSIVNAKIIDPTIKISGYGNFSTLHDSDFPWTPTTDGVAYVSCALDTSGADAYLYIRDTTAASNLACISTTDANGLALTTFFPVVKNHVYTKHAESHINSWYVVYFPFSYS